LGFTAPAAPKGPCRRGGPHASRRRAERVSRWALCAPCAHLRASAQRVTTRCSWNLPRVCLRDRICTSQQQSRERAPATAMATHICIARQQRSAAQAQRSARGREQARAHSRAQMRRTAPACARTRAHKTRSPRKRKASLRRRRTHRLDVLAAARPRHQAARAALHRAAHGCRRSAARGRGVGHISRA
jgi:hypothetical protein